MILTELPWSLPPPERPSTQFLRWAKTKCSRPWRTFRPNNKSRLHAYGLEVCWSIYRALEADSIPPYALPICHTLAAYGWLGASGKPYNRQSLLTRLNQAGMHSAYMDSYRHEGHLSATSWRLLKPASRGKTKVVPLAPLEATPEFNTFIIAQEEHFLRLKEQHDAQWEGYEHDPDWYLDEYATVGSGGRR